MAKQKDKTPKEKKANFDKLVKVFLSPKPEKKKIKSHGKDIDRN